MLDISYELSCLQMILMKYQALIFPKIKAPLTLYNIKANRHKAIFNLSTELRLVYIKDFFFKFVSCPT